MKLYLVGGCVRDKLLGIKPKDIDFVVLADSFEQMKSKLVDAGCEIFLEKPEFGTIRGKHPEFGPADFALPRSEEGYSDSRRPDKIRVVKTLEEDSLRRDFKIGAMYQDVKTQEIIDFHGGQKDIENRIITCVGNPVDRFEEDALRICRVLRFSITHQFKIGDEERKCLKNRDLIDKLKKISTERCYEELKKMFDTNTYASLQLLEEFNEIKYILFSEIGIKLTPTLKK